MTLTEAHNMATNKELFYKKMDALADAVKAGASGKKSLDELIELALNTSSGASLNGTTKQYKVATGETISAGDFVEYINSFTTPVSTSVRSGSYSSCVLLEENKIFIAHSDSTYNYLYGSIVVIEGNTFTVTTIKLNSTNYSCSRGTSCVLLEANKVLIIHGYQNNYYYLYATIVTINGTTMTSAATKMLNSSEKSCYTNPSAVLIDTNKVFIAHSYSSSYYLYGTLLTISGTTITVSSYTNLVSTTNYAYRSPKCVYLGNNKVFITCGNYANSRIELMGVIVSISGTSLTTSATARLIPADVYSCYNDPNCVLVGENKVLVVHSFGSERRLFGTLVTISGTTMSPTSLDLCGEDNSCYTATPNCILLEENKVLVIHPYSEYYKFYKTLITINGTTMTAETTKMNDENYGYTRESSCVSLGDGRIFISHAHDNSNYYLDGTIYIGECVKPYEKEILGVAQTSGSGDQTIDICEPNAN